jgi:hypothetical protein
MFILLLTDSKDFCWNACHCGALNSDFFGGLRSQWVGCFVARQSRIDPEMLLPPSSQTTHFEHNESQGIEETVH